MHSITTKLPRRSSSGAYGAAPPAAPPPGGGAAGCCVKVRGITACTVLWMRTGQEEETLAKAIGHVTLTGGPVLIRPFAQPYPGVDALLVVAAGKKATKSILLLAVQATVAANRPLSAGGAVNVELWADLCTSHGIAFDSLVYMLPRGRYKHWGPQDGAPTRLPQLAWTLQNAQKQVSS